MPSQTTTINHSLEYTPKHGLPKLSEISLVFQPIVEIGTRNIVGYEVLSRLILQKDTVMYPAIFIPSLEKLGLISNFDILVFQKALSSVNKLKLTTPLFFTINISASTLMDLPSVELIIDCYSEFVSPMIKIFLEITETEKISYFLQARKNIKKLQSAGIHCIADDFGIGYSSLQYLNELDWGMIKLDRTFISQIKTNQKSSLIINSIALLAQKLNLKIVAEGIENLQQYQYVEKLGINYAQGYYFGRPQKIEKTNLIFTKPFFEPKYTKAYNSLIC